MIKKALGGTNLLVTAEHINRIVRNWLGKYDAIEIITPSVEFYANLLDNIKNNNLSSAVDNLRNFITAGQRISDAKARESWRKEIEPQLNSFLKQLTVQSGAGAISREQVGQHRVTGETPKDVLKAQENLNKILALRGQDASKVQETGKLDNATRNLIGWFRATFPNMRQQAIDAAIATQLSQEIGAGTFKLGPQREVAGPTL